MKYDGTINTQLSLLPVVEESDVRNDAELPNRFLTESGLMLKLQKVNHQLVVDADARLVQPKPPQVYLKDEDRYIENPNSPTYQTELTAWANARYEQSNNIYLGLGVMNEFPSELPAGLHGLASDDWMDELTYLGLTVPEKGIARKVAWLRYHVFQDANEVNKCVHKVALYSGLVKEEEVEQAIETFPSDEERESNNGTLAHINGTDGDNS